MNDENEIKYTLDLTPQVVENNFNDIDPPKDSIGFIYLWTNLKNSKWYLGKHEGYPKDGYLFSSKDKDFLKEFTATNSQWRYEIMNFVNTTKADLTNLENRMLSERHDPKTGKGGAAKNPMSYNKSNGIPVKTGEPNEKKVHLLAERIMGKVDPTDPEGKKRIYEFPIVVAENNVPLKLIKDGDRIQNRYKDDTSLVTTIGGKIDDEGGNTDFCDPVTIVDAVYKGKERRKLLNDGTHTTLGIDKSAKGIMTRMQMIPFEETEGWSDLELELLGSALNPPKKKVKKESGKQDFEKFLRNCYHAGHKLNTENNKRIGKKTYGLHGASINGSISKVVKEFKDANGNVSGEIFRNYDLDPYKDLLERQFIKYNSKENVHCIKGGSSSYYKVELIMKTLVTLLDMMEADKKFVVKHLVVLLWHKSEETEEYWKKKLQPIYDGYNEKLLEHCGIKIEIKYMPTWDFEDDVDAK